MERTHLHSVNICEAYQGRMLEVVLHHIPVNIDTLVARDKWVQGFESKVYYLAVWEPRDIFDIFDVPTDRPIATLHKADVKRYLFGGRLFHFALFSNFNLLVELEPPMVWED